MYGDRPLPVGHLARYPARAGIDRDLVDRYPARAGIDPLLSMCNGDAPTLPRTRGDRPAAARPATPAYRGIDRHSCESPRSSRFGEENRGFSVCTTCTIGR